MNIEQRRATARAYYHRHKERILKSRKTEEAKVKRKQWYAKNNVRLQAKRKNPQSRGRANAWLKRWCKTEAGKKSILKTKLKQRWGLTYEQYQAMLDSQGRVCAICKLFRTTKRYEVMSVDHDHGTGEKRGILCSSCNRAIGLLMDDPGACENAMKYLLKHGKRPIAWRSIVETA